MKAVRLWFLLLLAVLLPLRAVLAATMLCAVGGSDVSGELRVHGQATGHQAIGRATDHAMHHGQTPGHSHDHGHGGMKDHAAHGHAASVDPPASSGHDHGAGHDAAGDTCKMCAAYCSLTPAVGWLPGVVEPPDLRAATLPPFTAPPPSFVSEGQERPPRRI